MKKVVNICRCGEIAKVEKPDTGEWLCYGCAIQDILFDLARGEPVNVSLTGGACLSDVVLIPDSDSEAHILVYLHEAVPISFCRN